jgi:small conductance mechanosensitive channel
VAGQPVDPQAAEPGMVTVPADHFTAEAIAARGLDMLIDYTPRVLGVLILLSVGWIIAGWVRRAINRMFANSKVDLTLVKFLANASRWIILVLSILACLGTFGLNVTSFATVLGAAGLAIALGFQGSLSNLAAGIMLMVFRPFKIGDVVVIAGQLGVVDGIDLFTTYLDTPDNRRIVLPNSQIFGNIIENITYHPRRRTDVKVGVVYAADIDRTREVLEDAAKRVVESVPGALAEPPPQVILIDLGASSVNWEVRVWAESKQFFPVRQGSTTMVKKALDTAGIGIPFPQMDVWIKQVPPPQIAAPASDQQS